MLEIAVVHIHSLRSSFLFNRATISCYVIKCSFLEIKNLIWLQLYFDEYFTVRMRTVGSGEHGSEEATTAS